MIDSDLNLIYVLYCFGLCRVLSNNGFYVQVIHYLVTQNIQMGF